MSIPILASPPNPKRCKPTAKTKPTATLPRKVKPRPEPRPAHSSPRTVEREGNRAAAKRVAKALGAAVKKVEAIAATRAAPTRITAPAPPQPPPFRPLVTIYPHEDLIELVGIVTKAINRRYPELLPAFKAAFAVVGAMALGGRKRPLSVIFEGPSGFGKSEVISSFYPLDADSGIRQYVYRSDSWTSKSFVTHASGLEKGQLKKADMLPRIINKILLTKELATMFRGKQDQLADTFKVLIAVLDGEGLLSDSGTQGQRGYDGRAIFNWIGGTTPLPDATQRLMSQLGNRLLFYEVPSVRPQRDKLVDYIASAGAAVAETDQHEVRRLVNALVELFFIEFPLGSIPPGSILFPRDLMGELASWAMLVAAARAPVRSESTTNGGSNYMPVSADPAEGPWRVTDYLKELILGHALIHGRDFVDDSDMRVIEHIAISSCPRHLRLLIRELALKGTVNTSTAILLCQASHYTCRKYMSELSVLGIARLHKGNAAANQADTIELAGEFEWLRKWGNSPGNQPEQWRSRVPVTPAQQPPAQAGPKPSGQKVFVKSPNWKPSGGGGKVGSSSQAGEQDG
jgi:hypothetical protein